MDLIIKVNNQTAGRDKIARVVQYTSRLVWSELQKKNPDRYTIDHLKKLESACSSFRKLLRFGRSVDSLHSVLATINHPDYVVRATLTSSKIFNSVFLFADHILWLAKSGFLKDVDSDKWNEVSNKYWVFSISMNLLRDLYEITKLLHHERSYVFGAQSGSVNYYGICYYIGVLAKALAVVNRRRDVVTDTVKNFCDLWLPLSALGRVDLQPSTIGILGTISSLAGLLAMVQPAAKLTPA